MSSDMKDEAEITKVETNVEKPEEEKKKVTVKIASKRRVSVKKTASEEAEETKQSKAEEPLGEEKPQEEENAPKKRGRKPRKTNEEKSAPRQRKPRAKKEEKAESAEEIKAEENAVEEMEPSVEAEIPSPVEEKKEEVEVSETKGTEETNEEASVQDSAQEEKKDEWERRPDRRDRFQRGDNRNNKFKNKKERRPQEELPPEVNLDEKPDAPRLFISVLTALSLEQVRARAKEDGIPEDVILDCRKQDLIAKLLRLHSQMGWALMVEGVLEILSDGGYGYIRYGVNNYLAGTEDVYVSASMIKAVGLKTGDIVMGQIRAPRENEKSAAMIRVLAVNGEEPKMAKIRAPFDSLTPLFPN